MSSIIEKILDEKQEKDNIKRTRFEELKETENATLKDVYEVYDKYMHISDKKRIDILLATALTRKLKGTPIWLFIVGPSGDGKSEMVNALEDEETTVMLHEITPNTLVSGMSKAGELDLAPKLRDKLVIFSDMAQLLTLHPNDKAKVWGQLRELYDGRAGKDTGVSSAKYKNIRVTLIACSTPSIDAQILVFSHLGTRELIYRTCENDHVSLMNKVRENEKIEDQMKIDLKEITKKFLKYTTIRDIEPNDSVFATMVRLIEYLRYMRASAEIDSYTGDLRNDVYPEQPTRPLKQFTRLYRCLMSLEDNYTNKRALEVIRHIVKSSISPVRQKIFNTLMDESEQTTNSIAHIVKIGNKTAKRELGVLWNLEIVDRTTVENEDKPWITIDYWKITKKGQYIGKIMKEEFTLTN